MRPELRTGLKLAAALVVVVVALAFVVSRLTSLSRSGEQDAQVWFYDLSKKRLYAGSPDIPPPDRGIGGASGDGVRAIVVAYGSTQGDARSRRIAYLQTYTPELKALLDRVRAARAAGRPFEGRIPSRESDYFQINTLVSRPEAIDWQASNNSEGQRIMSEWRSWRGPNGEPPGLSTP